MFDPDIGREVHWSPTFGSALVTAGHVGAPQVLLPSVGTDISARRTSTVCTSQLFWETPTTFLSFY